ncbi:insulin-like 3 (Leydig cell) [Eucyclogobius newberryi]|uniref:insulin-like 3 (Leydig cell) n=1 Tax=Eucyclogobius newberryi TaxID=166745 RepID=UPI003B5BFF31
MSVVKRVLVLVVVVGLVVEAEGQENIKMCGRDLIRHAVSYCGNSRLKRAVLTLEGPQQQGGNNKSSLDATISAGDLATSDPATSDPAPAPAPPTSQPGEQGDMEALMARWLPLSARMRRTALKISDLCCEKGCSKRELIQFC